MAFENVKENLSDAEATIKSYAESSGEYYKLKAFKFLMKGVTSITKGLMVGSFLFLALLFLSFAASYGIGQALGNMFYGFLVIGGLYMLIGILSFVLRNTLNKPLLRKFSEYYFDE